jgi:hypothetical protein
LGWRCRTISCRGVQDTQQNGPVPLKPGTPKFWPEPLDRRLVHIEPKNRVSW